MDFTGFRCRLHRQQDRQQVGEGLILDIILGVVGAIVGGFLFSPVGGSPVTGLNFYSLIVAVIGAIVVLVVYHAIRDGRRTI